jgi:hypothetical protein
MERRGKVLADAAIGLAPTTASDLSESGGIEILRASDEIRAAWANFGS